MWSQWKVISTDQWKKITVKDYKPEALTISYI